MQTKNIQLLLTGSALAVFGALALQGCGSSGDDSAAAAGSAGKGGTGSGGTSTGTAGKGGAATTAGTSSGGTGGGSAGTGTAGTGGGSAGTSAGGTGGAGGGTGGAGGGGGGTGGGGAGGTGGSSGDGRDCTKFCADEATTCSGTLSPYATPADCMTACMGFALGGDPTTTTSGNTYACRRYHLSAAASPGPATTHCPHTGLISKNSDGTTATAPCK